MIIDGITVKIVRKRIKNAYIRIADDYSAVISAPYGISQQTLERFFIENADGVRRAIAKKKSVAGGDYLADGYLYVFGVKKRFTISESKDNSVIETVDGVVARCSVKDRKKLDDGTVFLEKNNYLCIRIKKQEVLSNDDQQNLNPH